MPATPTADEDDQPTREFFARDMAFLSLGMALGEFERRLDKMAPEDVEKIFNRTQEHLYRILRTQRARIAHLRPGLVETED